MGFDLRTFDESRDLPGVADLYNTVFGPLRPYYSWPMTVERLRDRVLSHWEYRREGFWLACDGPRIVGFALAAFRSLPLIESEALTPESSPVFLSSIGVDGRYRRRGIGRELCRKVCEFARENGRDRVLIATNPSAPMAFGIGVQEDWQEARRFLPAVGFGLGAVRPNMVRGISGYRIDEPTRRKIEALAAEGCECRAYREQDYSGLVGLLDEHRWPYWYLDMLSKVGKWTKTRPFMETCFLSCGSDHIYGPDEIGVVVKGGEMLSFCAQTINPQTRIAYLGPMLTSSKARNRGLGTVSLQVSLQIAAQKGAAVCDLWTGSEASLTHFYRKSGFEHVMNWMEYEMKLK